MPEEVNSLSTEQLEAFLYVKIESFEDIVIECNQCSVDDFVFSSASTYAASGWLERAAQHVLKNHQEELKEIR